MKSKRYLAAILKADSLVRFGAWILWSYVNSRISVDIIKMNVPMRILVFASNDAATPIPVRASNKLSELGTYLVAAVTVGDALLALSL